MCRRFQRMLFATLFVLALTGSCHCRYTPQDTSQTAALQPATSAPKQPATTQANGLTARLTDSGQCASCTPTQDTCQFGAPVCVDTSSGANSNLPCELLGPTTMPGRSVEPKGIATASQGPCAEVGASADGGCIPRSWTSATGTGKTSKATAAQELIKQTGPVSLVPGAIAEKAQDVHALCPKDKPTRMCCGRMVFTNSTVVVTPPEPQHAVQLPATVQQNGGSGEPADSSAVQQPATIAPDHQNAGQSIRSSAALTVAGASLLVLMLF